MSSKKKTVYPSIDIMKFVASIMILTMHVSPFRGRGVQHFYECLCRWCVPFFFISSSFLLFSKVENGNVSIDKLKYYVHRIWMLYLSWLVVNIPSIVYGSLIKPGIHQTTTWITFFRTLLLNGTFSGSWYLLSSIASAFILYELSKIITTKSIILVTLPIQAACVLSSVYGRGMPCSISKVLGWLCFPMNIFGGVFYFALGKYLSENLERLCKIKMRVDILIVLLSLGIYSFEIAVANKYDIFAMSDQGFALAPMSFFICVACLKHDRQRKCIGFCTTLLRKSSVIIYCAQSNVLHASPLILQIIGIGATAYVLRWGLSVCMIAVITVIVLYANKHFRFAKYLV